MYPRLITTRLFTIYSFGAILAAAYLTAFWCLLREGRREKLHRDALSSVGIWCIYGAILGAKALWLWRNPQALLSSAGLSSAVKSAGDFYGGFLGAATAAGLFLWRNPGLSFWRVADVSAPAIALGQAIGRIGCLMAGDDYGRPTQVPWAVTFTDPEAATVGGAPLGVPLHPVQVYESLICALIFGVVMRLLRHKRFDGQVVLVYTLLYAVARFALEFFRGDMERGFVIGWLSTSQFIAAILAPAAIALLFMRRRPRALRLGAGGLR